MPTKNVNLTDHYSDFVERLIASGAYKNASEVFRAGLRLLERESSEERQKLKLLRKLAGKGFDQLDQGEGIELASEDRLAAHIGKIGRKAARSSDGRKRS